MATSKECLQAPLRTPSSPDRSRLVTLALDYTRLSRPKPNREPVRRLDCPGQVNFALGQVKMEAWWSGRQLKSVSVVSLVIISNQKQIKT